MATIGASASRSRTAASERQVKTSAQKLRQKAELCRRVAAIATEGGATADRVLMKLAHRLEQEVDAAERKASGSVTAKIPDRANRGGVDQLIADRSRSVISSRSGACIMERLSGISPLL
jgi:hypothetical protein